MKTLDLIGTAVSNTFRSKTRLLLTILAIFVGAADTMTVTKTSEATGFGTGDSGPAEYNPDAVASAGPPGATVSALLPADVDALAGIEGIVDVQATKSLSVDFVQAGAGTKFAVGAGSLVEGQTVQLLAGSDPDDASGELQLPLPTSYVEPLGFADADAAVGQTVTIGSTDALRGTHETQAVVVGVAEESIASPVIDGIVLVLNAFAVIALLAASFGIVNTLLMSVQDRTREIGLMKAMGMGSGRVFTLFSVEAAFIGLLGSAIGALVAVVAGTVISAALATTLLADLPGLTLIAFDPVSIGVVIVVVMIIAFLAGTLPAARAARADPVESLRYE